MHRQQHPSDSLCCGSPNASFIYAQSPRTSAKTPWICKAVPECFFRQASELNQGRMSWRPQGKAPAARATKDQQRTLHTSSIVLRLTINSLPMANKGMRIFDHTPSKPGRFMVNAKTLLLRSQLQGMESPQTPTPSKLGVASSSSARCMCSCVTAHMPLLFNSASKLPCRRRAYATSCGSHKGTDTGTSLCFILSQARMGAQYAGGQRVPLHSRLIKSRWTLPGKRPRLPAALRSPQCSAWAAWASSNKDLALVADMSLDRNRSDKFARRRFSGGTSSDE